MWVASIALAPLIGGCGGNDAPTHETSALRLCSGAAQKASGRDVVMTEAQCLPHSC